LSDFSKLGFKERVIFSKMLKFYAT
jgi:hypothetical protein